MPEPRGTIDHGLDLGIIGNGRLAALIDPCSRIVWWCYPRFDGDPIFCRLVSGQQEKGFSDVVLEDMVDYQSEYVRNSAIICTVLTDRHGGKVKITDFAPRFRQFGRVFRPPQTLSHRRAAGRPAAHHRADAADLRLRQADSDTVRSAATISATPPTAPPSV